MSESDDSEIQADIQALTEALSLPTTNEPQQLLVSSNWRSDSTSSIDIESSDDEFFNSMNQDNESLNAYELNAKLITGLLVTKKKLIVMLQECEKRIKEVDEKISSCEKPNLRITNKVSVSNAGMPYFKDKNQFRAPKNYDTKLKETRGELFLPSLKKPSRWTKKEREVLLKAIHNEAIELILSTEFNEEIDKQSDNEMSNNEAKKIALTLPRNFREMVGAIGEKEFDWHKISRIDFEDKHSPGECEAMWNVFSHPDFNKSEWTNTEDNRLIEFAKECKYQDWDTITQLLGTNRSGYQCFIRYNSIKKLSFPVRAWNIEEDKCLMNIIDELKIGDYIPWFEIANHMRHRTKQQIYMRWKYRKAPHLTKGRFTYSETRTLMNAIEKYGTDFSKIASNVMPHRTSVQLSERYQTIVRNVTNDRIWTIDDDERLLELHEQYQNDWSQIATYFPNKSRTQVRHRFNALEKYTKRNISFQDIPRSSFCINKQVSTCKKSSSKNSGKQLKIHASVKKHNIIHIDDIQLRLYETLSLPLSETIKSQNSYDSEQLTHDTKKLYNTLKLLNTNLDFSSNFLNYAHLNNREKELVVSLKEYTNIRNNKTQNHEKIEQLRLQMFGAIEKVSKTSFIPPLPFDGYVKAKKVKSNTELINVNEIFNNDMPTEFSIIPYMQPFISIEDEIQFYKISQLLISDYHECDVNLYKLIECNLSFDKANPSLEYSDSTDVNLKLTNRKQTECLDKLQTPVSTDCNNDEDDKEKKILFDDIITPNRATLLGFKNLLLWKLLYEYKNNSEGCKFYQSEQETTNCLMQTGNPEYKLLQTRLLQLFKLPMGLSNTVLELSGPDPIFLTKKGEYPEKRVSKKRKYASINPVELDEKTHNCKVVVNSSSTFNSDIEGIDLPKIRSCKLFLKKYKIIAK